jgi:hypothetical protein
MIDILSTYSVFLILGLSLGAYGWLAIAYGMAFRFSRRFIHVQQTLLWLAGGLLNLLVFSMLRDTGRVVWERGVVWGGVALIPCVALWQRWSGRVQEPGYAVARELLVLHRPDVHPVHGDDAAGLYVPSLSTPDTRPVFRWRGVLGGIGILASIVVIMWILSIFDV